LRTQRLHSVQSLSPVGNAAWLAGESCGKAVHAMTQVIDQLRLDHRNMLQLLRVLEEELDAISAGGVADFDLMKQIIDYSLHYPGLIHHPREDLLFRRLLARDPAAMLLVGDLTKEHDELMQLTQRFAAALHNIVHDAELPRAWFESLSRGYVATLRRHMAKEEETLFPRLLATLADSDWAELDAMVVTGYDPLFGSSIEKHYHDLHRRIMQTST
jgi:hemerythrin-like domain-containing protein